ncbi:hypothetical protein Hanom_Chr04g00379721 [Helianthus anomalus]
MGGPSFAASSNSCNKSLTGVLHTSPSSSSQTESSATSGFDKILHLVLITSLQPIYILKQTLQKSSHLKNFIAQAPLSTKSTRR